MKTRDLIHRRVVAVLLFGSSCFLTATYPASLAQATGPITPSGLHTQVSGPIPVDGQTQYDITGGTRPGGGVNLFHSFGTFNVPNNQIANFLNESGLPTSNILGRVNGGNPSSIFGTIQTTGFGNANVFLMNPAGIVFGPTALLNVGGSVTFTTADYIKLADGVRFKALAKASADQLLSAAPVAAFGFLGSHPGAITLQGSQLSVPEGSDLALVGGNIQLTGGALKTPSGQITLVGVGKPSRPHHGGEVVIAGAGSTTGFVPRGFRNLGTIHLAQGSTLQGGESLGLGDPSRPGSVVIRGGQFVMEGSSIRFGTGSALIGSFGGTVEVTAKSITLSNSSIAKLPTLFDEGGSITLVSRGGIDIRHSELGGGDVFEHGPAVDFKAGTIINLTDAHIREGLIN